MVGVKAHAELFDVTIMFILTVRLVLQVKEAFAGTFAGFKSVLLKSGIRCNRISVYLALIFNSKTSEQDVITVLRDAKDGRLRNFSISAMKRTKSITDFEEDCVTPSGSSEECNRHCNDVLLEAIIGFLALIILLLITYIIWLHRKGGVDKKRTYEDERVVPDVSYS